MTPSRASRSIGRPAADRVGGDLEAGRVAPRPIARSSIARHSSATRAAAELGARSRSSAGDEPCGVEPARPARGEVARPAPGRPARTTTRPRSRAPGRARGEHLDDGAARVALELDVEEGPPADRRQDLGAASGPRACPSAAAVSASTRSGRPWTRVERRVVDEDRDAVGRGADVELEAVAGRDGERGRQRGERVLRARPASRRDGRGEASAAAPSSLPDPSQAAIPRWSLGIDRRVLGVRPVEHQPGGRRPARRRGPRCSRGSSGGRRCPSPGAWRPDGQVTAGFGAVRRGERGDEAGGPHAPRRRVPSGSALKSPMTMVASAAGASGPSSQARSAAVCSSRSASSGVR